MVPITKLCVLLFGLLPSTSEGQDRLPKISFFCNFPANVTFKESSLSKHFYPLSKRYRLISVFPFLVNMFLVNFCCLLVNVIYVHSKYLYLVENVFLAIY